MSNRSDEHSGTDHTADQAGEGTEGISDDKLPEDLRPTDDNPLAKPLTEDDDVEAQSAPQAGPGVDDLGAPGAG